MYSFGEGKVDTFECVAKEYQLWDILPLHNCALLHSYVHSITINHPVNHPVTVNIFIYTLHILFKLIYTTQIINPTVFESKQVAC